MKIGLKITAFVLCIAMLFGFAGCAEDTSDLVAKVNGKDVTYSDYYTTLNAILSYYSLTPDSLDEYIGVEQANNLRDDVVDELIMLEITMQKAEENNVAQLSDEEKEEAQQLKQEFYDSVKESLRYQVELSMLYAEEGSEAANLTEEQIQAKVDQDFKNYIAETGLTDEYLTNYYEKSIIYDKVYNLLTESATVADEDIQTYYDENLLAQKSVSTETALDNYVNNLNDVNLFVPSGIRYVKHILIKIPDDARAEIESLDGDEREARYQEELSKIKAKADEALEKAKAGEDFDALIEQYGEDEGMTSEPVKTQGYAIYTGSGMVEEFEAAALALQNVGDISDLVATEFGYHIIKYESAPQAGALPLEQVKDQIIEVLKEDARAEMWANLIEQWFNEAEIQYFTENYHSVEEPEPTPTSEAGDSATDDQSGDQSSQEQQSDDQGAAATN